MINRVDSFLIKHNSHISNIDEKMFIKDFILEINKGLTSKSSIAMEPTFIYGSYIVKKNSKPYVLLDAGGTNLRGCIGYIKNNKPIFKNIKTRKMFGVDQPINKKDFYDSFYCFIKSISKEDLDIGCCFSFTCKMNDKLDGKIINFGKKIITKGVVGTYFAKELKSRFNSDINISIINDAISTNLGSQYGLKKDANYISYIWGTGINASYYETRNKGKELINTEICGFNKFKLSDFEKALIKSTNKLDMFEKTSGGVYFASIINNALNKAHEEKLITLKKKVNLSLIEYSNLLTKNDSSIFKDINSYKTAKLIIVELIKRAAKLNALALSSIILKINNHKPYCVTIEGSTILKLPYLKKYFVDFTKKYSKNYKIKFLTSTNLNLKGALLVAANQ